MKKPITKLLLIFAFILVIVTAILSGNTADEENATKDPTPVDPVPAVAPTVAAEPTQPDPVPDVVPSVTSAPAQVDPAPVVAPVVMEVPATQEETKETETPQPTTAPKPATPRAIELLARTIWGEAEIVESQAERAGVGWCVLNRVDDSGESIEDVILAPYQFYCRMDGEVPAWAIELAEDVVGRWELEHAGQVDVGRTLPADYKYFFGDGWRNHFSAEWGGTEYWDWSLPDPYKD